MKTVRVCFGLLLYLTFVTMQCFAQTQFEADESTLKNKENKSTLTLGQIDSVKPSFLINLEISVAMIALSNRSDVLKLEDTGSLTPSVGVSIERTLSNRSNGLSFQTGLNYSSYSKQIYAFNVLSGDAGNEPIYRSNFFFGTDFSAFAIPLNIKKYIPLQNLLGYLQVGASLNFLSGFKMSAFESRAERASGNIVAEFSNSIELDREIGVGFNARIGINKPLNQNYFGGFIEYRIVPALSLDKSTGDLNDELFLPGSGYGQNDAIFKGFYGLSAGLSFSF